MKCRRRRAPPSPPPRPPLRPWSSEHFTITSARSNWHRAFKRGFKTFVPVIKLLYVCICPFVGSIHGLPWRDISFRKLMNANIDICDVSNIDVVQYFPNFCTVGIYDMQTHSSRNIYVFYIQYSTIYYKMFSYRAWPWRVRPPGYGQLTSAVLAQASTGLTFPQPFLSSLLLSRYVPILFFILWETL